jgi:hypothetical protein
VESWQNQRRLFEGVAPIFIGEPEPVEEEDRLNWESAGRIIDEEARQLKRIKAETSTFPPFPHQSKYDRECSTPTPADRGTARKKGRQ